MNQDSQPDLPAATSETGWDPPEVAPTDTEQRSYCQMCGAENPAFGGLCFNCHQQMNQDSQPDLPRGPLDPSGSGGFEPGRVRPEPADLLSGPVPPSGTEKFSRYSQQAFAGRFSDTPALLVLWQEARFAHGSDPACSRKGFNTVRGRFWNLVREQSSENAKVVRDILDEAGFVMGGSGAPRLRIDVSPPIERTRTGLSFEDIAGRMLRETAIDRHGQQLTAKQRLVRQVAERSLDIDHAYPASRAEKDLGQPEKWLDPSNLQFMMGDDNRWHKGDRHLT